MIKTHMAKVRKLYSGAHGVRIAEAYTQGKGWSEFKRPYALTRENLDLLKSQDHIKINLLVLSRDGVMRPDYAIDEFDDTFDSFDDGGTVWRNQAERDYWLIAERDDGRVLIEYEMPNGTSALNWFHANGGDADNAKTISYAAVLKSPKWLKALAEVDGLRWEGNPQSGYTPRSIKEELKSRGIS